MERFKLKLGQQLEAHIVSGANTLERFPVEVKGLDNKFVRLTEIVVPTREHILPRQRVEQGRRVGILKITKPEEQVV